MQGVKMSRVYALFHEQIQCSLPQALRDSVKVPEELYKYASEFSWELVQLFRQLQRTTMFPATIESITYFEDGRVSFAIRYGWEGDVTITLTKNDLMSKTERNRILEVIMSKHIAQII